MRRLAISECWLAALGALVPLLAVKSLRKEEESMERLIHPLAAEGKI